MCAWRVVGSLSLSLSSTHLSIHESTVRLSVCLSVSWHLWMCLPAHLAIHLYSYLSYDLFMYACCTDASCFMQYCMPVAHC